MYGSSLSLLCCNSIIARIYHECFFILFSCKIIQVFLHYYSNYLLTGKKVSENSIASTTQIFDARNRVWSNEVIEALGLPKKIFTKIVPSGTVIGQVS